MAFAASYYDGALRLLRNQEGIHRDKENLTNLCSYCVSALDFGVDVYLSTGIQDCVHPGLLCFIYKTQNNVSL